MRRRDLRMRIARWISILPGNGLRVWLYRSLLGYDISNSTIGRGTIIAVDQAVIKESNIGSNNVFSGPLKVTIGRKSNISENNQFICGWWSIEGDAKLRNYDRILCIGEHTLITSGHYFDVVGAFYLGDYSWVAGYASQFWTHGAGVNDRNVKIGKHCYLGSSVLFAPGAVLQDYTLLALGSVVTKSFPDAFVMVGGVPARVLRANYNWKTKSNVEPLTAGTPSAS